MKTVPSGKTRFWIFIFFLMNICGAWWMGNIEYLDWFEGFKWVFGIYAVSEVGAKGAHAHMNRSE